ncbi:hypothetical protein [Paenibacillus methanolicus]|uniref:Uncharacterized protein n=1 Tax=Paenibacillus methanolicus TaxID=582686 RepID=A0A5S5C5W1_9BACL|nr:hypothetical protein [Paenibacillus methanolicus]TYP74821.1 hypothetical protein BCM02_105368 [Paenibacillus methanolicus]
MKRVMKWVAGWFVLLAAFLMLTRPGDMEYYVWLLKKHEIHCTIDGGTTSCWKGGQPIEEVSRSFHNRLLFTQVRDIYKEGNKVYDIRAVGVFHRYYDFTSIQIYN